MPRPRKFRKVCRIPDSDLFGPLREDNDLEEVVVMSVDEYETIRLIDLNGYTQVDCALQMKVARTTIQGIYDSARYKLAQALVDGRLLRVEGGEVRICEGIDETCGHKECYKANHKKQRDNKETLKEREKYNER